MPLCHTGRYQPFGGQASVRRGRLCLRTPHETLSGGEAARAGRAFGVPRGSGSGLEPCRGSCSCSCSSCGARSSSGAREVGVRSRAGRGGANPHGCWASRFWSGGASRAQIRCSVAPHPTRKSRSRALEARGATTDASPIRLERKRHECPADSPIWGIFQQPSRMVERCDAAGGQRALSAVLPWDFGRRWGEPKRQREDTE